MGNKHILYSCRTFMSLVILLSIFLNGSSPVMPGDDAVFPALQDTLRDKQILFNGRVWRNLHSQISGSQFLFSQAMLAGTVSINGRTFSNILLRYDAYKDELITETPHGINLQLNKEMVDSFTLKYNDKEYLFTRSDSTNEYSGFVNLLYKGQCSFVVKYHKKIELLAVDKMYDQFYLVNRMFLVRDSLIDQFSGKIELLKLFGDHGKEVRNYIRKNKVFIRKNDPESFIPVIEFYDRIRK